MDIVNYGLHEKYDQLKKFGDKLSDMKNMIGWNQFRPILDDLYRNDTQAGGRPNFDPVFMVKIMFLQSLYGLVDEAMERGIYERISFINFLDYPESIPDSRTIWLFRERLSSTGKDKMIWKETW
jgi:IS5 family transposase